MGVIDDDPILKRIRAALDDLYGDRIERVVLFGSRARGDAGDDSDYDSRCFSEGPRRPLAGVGSLADLRSEFLEARTSSSTSSRIRPVPTVTGRR